MVKMSKLGLALAPMLTLKVLINIRFHNNIPFRSINNFFYKTFLKSTIQGLPDGQDGQVEACHGSRFIPEGPDKFRLSQVTSYEWVLTNFKKPLLEKKEMTAE